MGTAHVSMTDIVHEYEGVRALEVGELSVERGKTLALIGPNGSGKSTLLRLMGCLEKPTSGRIEIDGEDPWNNGKALVFRRKMAAVFQEPLLFSGSVVENVKYGLKLRRLPKKEVDKTAERVLEMVGISHLGHRPSSKLSGGEAQRTSLARALALEPEILLLDEPLAALDPPTREALLEDFERIIKRAKVTVGYVTHNRTEAVRLGDDIAVLVGGALHQVGAAADVFARPDTTAVADIVGVENRFPGRVVDSREGLVTVDIGPAHVEAVADCATGEEVIVCLRPEEITIMEGRLPLSSARNRFEGDVAKVIHMGPLSRVVVSAGVEMAALVTSRSVEEMGLMPGSRVTAAFKATGVHVIKAVN
ncbi:MAG: ABC transporter ATP-binding protein [Candidatus Aquicultorales bacterium]